MKVAVAQIDCELGNSSANCSKILAFTRQASEQGCQVVVFPEMVDTGYEMSTIGKTASTWAELPLMEVKRTAKENAMYLICGLSEKETRGIFNSIAVINPDGELIGKYRKTHLFPADPVDEDRYLAAGDTFEVVKIGDMEWGLSICFDLRFPEVARRLVQRGAEVLVVCSAWPVARQAHWKALTLARAIENQCYVVGANRVGTDGTLTFCGSSCLIDPVGTPVASGSMDREEILVGEIASETVNNHRQTMPFLECGREDLYRAWETG